MRILWATAALAALAACEPTVPDSGAGVGFGVYESYEAQRQARDTALRNSQAQIAPATPSAPVISSEELSAAGLPSATTGAGVATTAGASTAVGPTTQASAVATATGSSTGTATVTATGTGAVSVNNPGISDENDFSAVAARETIESDRERLEQNAAAYTVIQPTAVPERPGDTGPNIAAYALSTTNAVGQPLYSRSGINLQERSLRACAAYASPDLAQIDFLAEGGPQKDRKNLDPDGDGFACSWDPAPFRLAASG